MGKDSIKFVGSSMLINLVLAVLEVFIGSIIIDIFVSAYFLKLGVYLILFILINPLASWLLLKKLNFSFKEVNSDLNATTISD